MQELTAVRRSFSSPSPDEVDATQARKRLQPYCMLPSCDEQLWHYTTALLSAPITSESQLRGVLLAIEHRPSVESVFAEPSSLNGLFAALEWYEENIKEPFFTTTLARLVESAQQLKDEAAKIAANGQVPVLRSGYTQSLRLSRPLVRSMLAHATLCNTDLPINQHLSSLCLLSIERAKALLLYFSVNNPQNGTANPTPIHQIENDTVLEEEGSALPEAAAEDSVLIARLQVPHPRPHRFSATSVLPIPEFLVQNTSTALGDESVSVVNDVSSESYVGDHLCYVPSLAAITKCGLATREGRGCESGVGLFAVPETLVLDLLCEEFVEGEVLCLRGGTHLCTTTSAQVSATPPHNREGDVFVIRRPQLEHSSMQYHPKYLTTLLGAVHTACNGIDHLPNIVQSVLPATRETTIHTNVGWLALGHNACLHFLLELIACWCIEKRLCFDAVGDEVLASQLREVVQAIRKSGITPLPLWKLIIEYYEVCAVNHFDQYIMVRLREFQHRE